MILAVNTHYRENSNGLKNVQAHQKAWALLLAHMTNFHIKYMTPLPPLAFSLSQDTDTETAEPIRQQNYKTIHVTITTRKGKKHLTYKAELGVESRPSAVKLLEEYLEAKGKEFKLRKDEGPPEVEEPTPKKAKTKRKRSL